MTTIEILTQKSEKLKSLGYLSSIKIVKSGIFMSWSKAEIWAIAFIKKDELFDKKAEHVINRLDLEINNQNN